MMKRTDIAAFQPHRTPQRERAGECLPWSYNYEPFEEQTKNTILQWKMDNGEWRQDFKIYDHLGSVRVVLRKKTPLEFLNDPTFPPTYYTVGQYNYEPFGEQTKNTDNSDRL